MGQNLELQLVINADGTATVRTLREIDDNLDDLNDTSARTERGVSSTFKSLASKVAMFGSALAGVATVGFGAMVKSNLEAVNELRTFTTVANTNAQEFQKLASGASVYGIESDKLADILKDMNDRVGDFNATGGGAMKDFFDNIAPKVGITADQFKNLSGADALQLYYNGLEKANLSQADMTFYLEAVASDATNLIPLLENGGDGFKKFGELAEKSGAILSEVDIKNAEKMNRDLKIMGLQWEGFKNSVVRAFMPILQSISDYYQANQELINSNLKGFIENTKTAFGYLKTAIGGTVDVLVTVADWISRNKEMLIPLVSGIVSATVAFKGIGAVVSVISAVKNATLGLNMAMLLLRGGMAVFSGLAFIASPIGIATVAIGALVAVGVLLYRNWDTVKAKASEVWDAIGGTIFFAVENINEKWNSLKSKASEVWDAIGGTIFFAVENINEKWNSLKSKASEVWDAIGGTIFFAVENITEKWNSLKTGASDIWNGIKSSASGVWDGIKNSVSSAVDSIKAKWNALKTGASDIWGSIKATVINVWNAIKGTVSIAISNIKAKIKHSLNNVIQIFKIVFNRVKNTVSIAFTRIKSVVKTGITIIKTIFKTGFNLIKTVVKTVFNAMKALVRGDFKGFVNIVKGGLQNAVTIAKSGVSKIWTAFKTLGTKLFSIGKDAVQGLINGIKGKISGAVATAKNLASSVASTVKNFFVIRSPSRLMAEYGGNISEGLAVGIKKDESKAVKSARRMSKKVAREIADVQRSIAVNGKGKLFKFDYDVKHGNYQGANKAQLAKLRSLIVQKQELSGVNKTLAKEIASVNEQFSKQTANIHKQIALFGNKEVTASLRYDFVNSDKYDNITDDKINARLQAMQKLKNLQDKQKMTNFQASNAEKLAQYQFETSLIGKQAEEVERLKFKHELLKQQKNISKDFSKVNQQAMLKETNEIIKQHEAFVRYRKELIDEQGKDWFGGMKSGLQGFLNSTKTLKQTMEDLTQSTLTKMTDGIANFVATGKGNFKDLTRSILQDISKVLVKMSMIKLANMYLKPLAGGGGFLGSLFSKFFANGGAFNSQGVNYFAKGDIFDRPTAFSYGGGKLGVMGEAGAEAIMPLTRGSDGKLGVKVYGNKQTTANSQVVNQVQIDIHVNNDGANADVQTSTQDSKKLAENLKAVVLQVLQDESRAGGMLARG